MTHYLDRFIKVSAFIGLGAGIYGTYGLFNGDQEASNHGFYTMIGAYPLTKIAQHIKKKDLEGTIKDE